MSSLLKIFYNNKIFHNETINIENNKKLPTEIRFTKILTKYSTEYNNYLFLFFQVKNNKMVFEHYL